MDDDALKGLERLSQLRRDGILTEAEFDREKSQILGGGSQKASLTSPDFTSRPTTPTVTAAIELGERQDAASIGKGKTTATDTNSGNERRVELTAQPGLTDWSYWRRLIFPRTGDELRDAIIVRVLIGGTIISALPAIAISEGSFLAFVVFTLAYASVTWSTWTIWIVCGYFFRALIRSAGVKAPPTPTADAVSLAEEIGYLRSQNELLRKATLK